MEDKHWNQELVCPHCGFLDEMTASAISSHGDMVTCLKCGQVIRLSADPMAKSIDAVTSVEDPRTQCETNAVFAVKFQTFREQDNRFAGTGTLKISGDMVEVSARRRRPFALGRTTETHQLRSVRNVTRSGKVVSFVLPLGRKHWQALVACSDEDGAAKLEALLPADKDPAFCSAKEARKELNSRLAELPGGTPAVWTLLVLNCLIYLAVAYNTKTWFAIEPGSLITFGGNFSPLTTEGQWWRIMSATFLHGGIIHLAFNMYALYVFGILVERLYGTSAFLGMYLLSGLSGSAGTLLASPALVGVGASGAIFGIMGALCVFLYTDRQFLSEGARKQLLTNFAIFATYSLIQGFGKSGIDNAAHIGGLMSGLLLGWMSGTPLRLREEKTGWLTGRVAAGSCIVLLGAAISIAAAPRLGPEYRIHVKMLEVTSDLGRKERSLGEMIKRVAEKKDDVSAEEVAQLKEQLKTTYDGFEERMDSLLPKAKGLQARKDLLRSYITMKKEACMLFARSFEGDDQQLVNQAKKRMADANKLLKQIKKPAVWYK